MPSAARKKSRTRQAPSSKRRLKPTPKLLHPSPIRSKPRHAQPQGFSQPHLLGESDTEDHQGHANGRGGKAAARPGGSPRGAPLFGPHGGGTGEPVAGHGGKARRA